MDILSAAHNRFWEHVGYDKQDKISYHHVNDFSLAREESFDLPCCWASVIGLDLRHPSAKAFLARWHALAIDGRTFPGPKWSGVFGSPRTASVDPRVKGHRHDQTAASVIALQLGMNQWLSKADYGLYFENDRDFARTYHEDWQGVGSGTDGVLRLRRDSEVRAAANS